MPTLSPTGAPLIDYDNDSPREDLPQTWEDLVRWIDQGRVAPFSTLDDARARYGFLPSDQFRLVWVTSTKSLVALYGASSMTIATLGSRWSNYNFNFYVFSGGTETALQTGARTSGRLNRSNDIVTVQGELQRTSATHIGGTTGWYTFRLPVDARITTSLTLPQSGTGYVWMQPSSVFVPCTAVVTNTDRLVLVSNLTGARIGPKELGRGNTNDAWGDNYRITYSIAYEAA